MYVSNFISLPSSRKLQIKLDTNTDNLIGIVAREKWHSTKSPDMEGCAHKYVNLKYKRPKKGARNLMPHNNFAKPKHNYISNDFSAQQTVYHLPLCKLSKQAPTEGPYNVKPTLQPFNTNNHVAALRDHHHHHHHRVLLLLVEHRASIKSFQAL
jgi:hypothetical protein